MQGTRLDWRGDATWWLCAALVLLTGAAWAAAALKGFPYFDSPPGRPASSPPVAARSVPTCAAAGITPTGRREGVCLTRTARLAIVNLGSPVELPGLRARVAKTTTIDATTPSGRRRDRMRVVVQLSVETTGGAAAFPSGLGAATYLSIAGGHVVPDTSAARQPGELALGQPLPAGTSRSGTVRFELAGAQSQAFRKAGAQLAIRSDQQVRGRRVLGVVRLPAGP